MRNFVETTGQPDTPLVVSIPHGGDADLSELPSFVQKALRLQSPQVAKTLRGGADIAAPHLAQNAVMLGAQVVTTRFPRAIIDVNRDPGNYHAAGVEGGDGDVHGVVWAKTVGEVSSEIMLLIAALLGDRAFPGFETSILSGIEPMLKRPYTPDEFNALLEIAYHPYKQAVREAVSKAIEKHGFAFVFEPHTITARTVATIKRGPNKGAYVIGNPVRGRGPLSFGGLLKGIVPDVLMFDGGGQTCPAAIVNHLREIFTGAGLVAHHDTKNSLAAESATSQYSAMGTSKNPVFVLAAELFGSHDIEPDRHLGSLEVNQEAVEILQPTYDAILRYLGGLTREQVALL